jgi:hypothetical protein
MISHLSAYYKADNYQTGQCPSIMKPHFIANYKADSFPTGPYPPNMISHLFLIIKLIIIQMARSSYHETPPQCLLKTGSYQTDQCPPTMKPHRSANFKSDSYSTGQNLPTMISHNSA